jgi:hypothetical protein
LSFEEEASREVGAVVVQRGKPSSESLEVLLVAAGLALDVEAVADTGEIGSQKTTEGAPVGTMIETVGFAGVVDCFVVISSETLVDGGITTGVPGILPLCNASLASLILVTH